MAVELRLHGALGLPECSPRTIHVAPGRALLDILGDLGLDGESVSILAINGDLVPAQAVPRDGDVVDVYPSLCGGMELEHD